MVAPVVAVLMSGCFLLKDPGEKQGGEAGASAAVERRIPVVLTPVANRAFEERLVVQGNVEAKNVATVGARIPGTVEAIFVDEGDPVVAGETKLFAVDALKVQKALEVRKQDVAVARCGRREKEANLERVEADLEKAEIDVRRFEKLYKDEAVSIDALEQQQSRFKQTTAMHKHALTLVDLGLEQLRQAEAALAIAEKDLSDATVYAPIDGVVSMRFLEPGEPTGVGTPVVRIEDPSVAEVTAFLPAQYYARIQPGETQARVRVYGIDAGVHPVSYKAPTVLAKLRTFEVKCVLEDPPEGVVPGAIAEIQVFFEQREGLGIPADAVQVRNDKKILFLVEKDRAQMMPVETGIETDGWIELLGGGVDEGVRVVTMGQYLLDDGSPVSVHGEGA